MRHTRWVIILSLGLFLLGSYSTLGASGADVGSLEKRDLWFRSSLGYPIDSPFLSVATFTATSQEKYGVPLTMTEEADLDRRIEVQERLDPLAEFVNSHSSQFSGVWLDQAITKGKGVAVVLSFPGEIDSELFREASRLVPDGVPVLSRVQGHSTAALNEALEVVEQRIALLPARGDSTRTWAVDVRENRVVVSSSDLDASDFSDLGDRVRTINGAELRPVACQPAERCTFLPYRGGLQLVDRFNGANWWQCTSGYWAKHNTSFYIISAAHCFKSGSGGIAYRDASLTTRLGTWSVDSIDASQCGTVCPANTETVRVLVDSARVPATGRNLIYSASSDKSHAITTYKGYALIMPGQTLCEAGAAGDLDCGFVDRVGGGEVTVDRYPKKVAVSKGIYVQNTDVVGGDSGGPLFIGAVGYGVTSAHWSEGSKVGEFASALSYTISDLGLTLCVTTTC